MLRVPFRTLSPENVAYSTRWYFPTLEETQIPVFIKGETEAERQRERETSFGEQRHSEKVRRMKQNFLCQVVSVSVFPRVVGKRIQGNPNKKYIRCIA